MLRAAILHECQNYLGGGDGLGGSEKNGGTSSYRNGYPDAFFEFSELH